MIDIVVLFFLLPSSSQPSEYDLATTVPLRGSMAWDLHVSLTAHPTARYKAVAKHDIAPGETILADRALAVALLPEQKGQRCDACFRRSSTLKRCSGCAEYWYCGYDCQNRHWKNNHKHVCKHIAKFRTMLEFQTSPADRQTDAFLLNHLVAEHADALAGRDELPPGSMDDPLETFISLLPVPTYLRSPYPPHCPMTHSRRISLSITKALFDRFSNNNFIVHSHLNPIGHGIFPLASRLFNHSCVPNAIVSYLFAPEGIRMTIKSLRSIEEGEEITIPYLDPALPYQRRQDICRFTYGFECSCPSCNFCVSLGELPDPSVESEGYSKIGDQLSRHVFPGSELILPSQPLFFSLPTELHVVLHEDFLPTLSETFVDAAHDGNYETAMRSGFILFALYVVLYPPGFPQIGMHCLEMAKTAWNASIQDTAVDGKERKGLVEATRDFLRLARDSFSLLGREGDEDDGPLYDCEALEELLETA